jgi:hypothetical protein
MKGRLAWVHRQRPRISQPAGSTQLVAADPGINPGQRAVVDRDRTRGDKLVQKTRQQLTDHLRAAAEEVVQVMALRSPFALGRVVGQPIALQHGNRLVEL